LVLVPPLRWKQEKEVEHMKHARSTTRKMFAILLVVVMLTVTLGTGIASAGAPPGGPGGPGGAPKMEMGHPKMCTYTVRRGDTLYGIARRFGTSVWQLAGANHIRNVNLIRAGQRLTVPCMDAKPPKDPCCVYRVKRGDSLSSIAARYHTSVWYLASVNHIANPNRIYAGQWLRVPCWDP
jgi:LysM repeat protein